MSKFLRKYVRNFSFSAIENRIDMASKGNDLLQALLNIITLHFVLKLFFIEWQRRERAQEPRAEPRSEIENPADQRRS
jgi:hypothetical protein